MKFTLRLLIFSIALVLVTACSSLAQDITPPPGYEYVPPPPTQDIIYYPSVPPDPAVGQAIFVEKCQPCHGEQGLGNGPDANDLPNPVSPIGSAEFARQAYPSDWFQVVTEGRIDRFMPPFLSLTERQRWDVLAYAMTLSTSAETVTRGQELYQANCASCHGDTGRGDGVEAANYSNGIASFADQVLMSELSKQDLLTGMDHPNLSEIPDVTISLSEEDRWAITDYLRALTFASPEEETAFENPLATTEPGAETTPGAEQPTQETPVDTPVGSGQGVISGQVVNLSGGEVPLDQKVVLHGFDQFQEVISTTTTVDANGVYRFEGLEIPEGRAYIISVDYKDTTYTSDLAVAEAGVNEYDLPVSIYETTTETDGLVIDRLHILFEFTSTQQVRVAELIIISNLTNKVVVSPDDTTPVMSFNLPEGATNLQFQEGALGRDFISLPNGFGDMRAVIPGDTQHQVLFSYDMVYENQLDISQSILYPVQNLIILSPDIGVTVTGTGLVSGGIQDVQGVPYEVFTGEGLPDGGELSLSLSGEPTLAEAAVITPSSNTNLAVGLGALGVAVLGVGVWLFRRSNTQLPEEEDDEEETDDSIDPSVDEMDADTLMDAIITLDDHYKAGELPEEAYLQRRAVLKEQLKKKLG